MTVSRVSLLVKCQKMRTLNMTMVIVTTVPVQTSYNVVPQDSSVLGKEAVTKSANYLISILDLEVVGGQRSKKRHHSLANRLS